MMSRYFVTCILLLSVNFFKLKANQPLCSDLQDYLSACTTMKTAVDLHDKMLMQSALEKFDSLNIGIIPQESIRLIKNEDEISPSIYFLPEFADNMLLNDFVLADLDETSLLRDAAIVSDISVSHHAIKAGGTLTYGFDGDGHVELLVITNGKTSPEISVKDLATGNIYKNYGCDEEKNASWLIWEDRKSVV